MNTTTLYADRLKTCLAGNAGMSPAQVRVLVDDKFQAIAAKIGPENAFRNILEHYGNEDVDQACASILQEQLEKLNREHPGIDRNPVTRVRRAISRFNANVDKCAVEVSGLPENLLPHQQAGLEVARSQQSNVKIKVPEWAKAKEKTFTAVAKHRSNAKLELEIRY